jgi:hypothetical protein
MSRADITESDNWFIGEDQPFRFIIVDETGARVDVTNNAIVFELSATHSGDPLFTINVAIDDGPNGVVSWTVAQDDTQGLTGDAGYWYVLRRTDSGSATELAYGTVQLLDVYVNY